MRSLPEGGPPLGEKFSDFLVIFCFFNDFSTYFSFFEKIVGLDQTWDCVRRQVWMGTLQVWIGTMLGMDRDDVRYGRPYRIPDNPMSAMYTVHEPVYIKNTY